MEGHGINERKEQERDARPSERPSSRGPPVVHGAILAHRFAPAAVLLLGLLDAHDVAQLGARQLPVLVLGLLDKQEASGRAMEADGDSQEIKARSS